MPKQPCKMIYITKQQAMDAIKAVPRLNKEELYWAIRAIPGTKIGKSQQAGRSFETRNQERCPHCGRSIDVYNVHWKIPKHVYCLWCGGAIVRAHGNRNPEFDYEILKGTEYDPDENPRIKNRKKNVQA